MMYMRMYMNDDDVYHKLLAILAMNRAAPLCV